MSPINLVVMINFIKVVLTELVVELITIQIVTKIAIRVAYLQAIIK